MGKTAKDTISNLLQTAGITINGSHPYDLQVHDEQFYTRVFQDGSLGLGESYMLGWWDSPEVDSFIERITSALLRNELVIDDNLFFKSILSKIINWQTKKRSLEVGKKHYDLGNPLFQIMLDSRMNYSCGYWKQANNLEDAQKAKLELCCQKLSLKPGMRLWDVGCGWGGLAKYAAEHFGVSVVGITISQQQYEYAKASCKDLPIEIRFQDYRDVDEKFDRVCSIGMFEHVGPLNYRHFMRTVRRCLKDDGLFLLHTIGNSIHYETDRWISKYIFPNGCLPSLSQITKSAENLFVMEDWHNFGADYDKTLMAWHSNFTQAWEVLQKSYDSTFKRMWDYYLLSCAGNFRARGSHLWQIVFSPYGVPGGYASVR